MKCLPFNTNDMKCRSIQLHLLKVCYKTTRIFVCTCVGLHDFMTFTAYKFSLVMALSQLILKTKANIY